MTGMMISASYDSGQKSYASCVVLKQIGNDHFKNKNFQSSIEYYTRGLLQAPTHHVKDGNEEYPLAVLYSNRSASWFRMKKYDDCIVDIKRAFANGHHDDARYNKLIDRFAWSYWHLKQYKNCEEVVKHATSRDGGLNSQEIAILKTMLSKVKSTSPSPLSVTKPNEKKVILTNGENEMIKSASSSVKMEIDAVKGRHLTATSNILPSSNIISEEAFCGVLNNKYITTHCNYCFRDVRSRGIPCHGCNRSIFCDETCRLKAWRCYHWLECNMWPVLQKVDIFAHVALREVLSASYHLSCNTHINRSGASDVCNFIASHWLDSFPASSSKTVKKKKKVAKKTTRVLDGCDPESRIYKSDYWSVYSMQTHASHHPKIALTKCGLYANYIAKVVNTCFQPQFKENKKTPNRLKQASYADLIANRVRSALTKLSLKSLQDAAGSKKSQFDVETFRGKVINVCENLATSVPIAKIKQQACFTSKEIPQSFQDILCYLIKHHMLQLYTNAQAIFDVVSDDPNGKSDMMTVTQQRIATAVFPTTSLMNHSCNTNTIVTFSGRQILVRAVHSVLKGHEVTHCYGPCISRHSFKQRQRILKEQYFFTCECDTCAKHKAGDTDQQAFLQQFTAYKCTECAGPILIQECDDDLSVHGRCANEDCKRMHDITNMYKVYNDYLHESNAVSQRVSPNTVDEGLKILLRCLEGMKGILYHNHRTIAAIHDHIAYFYSMKKEYMSAAPHILASLKVISMMFGSRSLEVARETFKLASLYFNANKLIEADKFLARALEVYREILPEESDEIMNAEALSVALEAFNYKF